MEEMDRIKLLAMELDYLRVNAKFSSVDRINIVEIRRTLLKKQY
jgi:hypothetical protein